MTNSCFLCHIQQQKIQIIWECDTLFSIFDHNPVSPGHALIIPKRHVIDIQNLSYDEWGAIKNAMHKVINIIRKTDLVPIYQQFTRELRDSQSIWFCQKALQNPRINTQPDAYNHGVNDGKAAGRTINHFHWHLIPRFDGDMDDRYPELRHLWTSHICSLVPASATVVSPEHSPRPERQSPQACIPV